MSYTKYVEILHEYMTENGITDADFKVYEKDLNEKILKAMYKRIIGYYSGDATSIAKAMKDNKDYYARYTNRLRA